MTLKYLLRGCIAVVFVFFNTTVNAMVCNTTDASVDWDAIGYDSDSGSCLASATVTDGSGTATSTAEISGDTIYLSYQFDIVGASVFSGLFESSANADFTIGSGGGTVLFGGDVHDGQYELSGPGVAMIGLTSDGDISLSTPGLYQLYIYSIVGFVAQTGGTGGLLTATVETVPVPAAVWLFGSGLIGLIGVARRKKA